MKEFVAAYVAAIGPEGFLAKRGLIPAGKDVLGKTQELSSTLPASPAAANATSQLLKGRILERWKPTTRHEIVVAASFRT